MLKMIHCVIFVINIKKYVLFYIKTIISVLDTVMISGKDVCCSVVFGTLVGVCV